jgi:hypothetical protein
MLAVSLWWCCGGAVLVLLACRAICSCYFVCAHAVVAARQCCHAHRRVARNCRVVVTDRAAASREKKLVDDYLARHDLQGVLALHLNDLVVSRPADPLRRIAMELLKVDRSRGILNLSAT